MSDRLTGVYPDLRKMIRICQLHILPLQNSNFLIITLLRYGHSPQYNPERTRMVTLQIMVNNVMYTRGHHDYI